MNTALMEQGLPATNTTSATRPRTSVIATLAVGLVLTVVVTIIPFVTSALADHVRDSFPSYSDARVDRAVTAWLVILTIIGVLGVAGWLWTIWIVEKGKHWARWAATALFLLGASVAVTDLLIKDVSGDTGLAPTLGWIEMLPCVAGLVAVVLLWRPPSSASSRRRVTHLGY